LSCETSELISELTFRTLEVESSQHLNLKNTSYLKSQEEGKIVLEFPSSLKVGEVIESVGLNLNLVTDLQLKEGSLEDAFLKILGQSGV